MKKSNDSNCYFFTWTDLSIKLIWLVIYFEIKTEYKYTRLNHCILSDYEIEDIN